MFMSHSACGPRAVDLRSHAPWLARAAILAAVNMAVIATAHAADYYVAANGKDSNPGTLGSPWKTIQYAANRVQAGDTVNIRAGTYVESITLKSSGSASQGYITFQNYLEETPVISGTDSSGKKLTVTGQQALINIVDRSYIKIAGLEIRDYTTSRADATPIGILVAGKADQIDIEGSHIHHISSTAEPAKKRDCQGSNPQAHGILVIGTNETVPITNLTINNNKLDHLTLGCSEALAINGNVETWKVTKNEIHDNNNIGIDAIGFEGTSKGNDQARGGEITGNKVYSNSSSGNKAYKDGSAAGIYCDGCTGVLIEGNTIYENDYGVEIASEHSGQFSSKVTVRNNLIYSNLISGLTIGGSSDHDNGDDTGGADNCTFVNNSFYGNDTTQSGSGEFQIQHHAQNIKFENNIVHAGSQKNFIIGTTTTSTIPTADGNLYFSSSAAAGSGVWTLNNLSYTGFDKYRNGTKQEKNSVYADPQYRNPSTGDLQVAKTSPAVDKGLALQETAGTKDFAGAPRVQGHGIDIGAYEQ